MDELKRAEKAYKKNYRRSIAHKEIPSGLWTFESIEPWQSRIERLRARLIELRVARGEK